MELKFMHDRDLYYLLQRVGPRPHSGMQIAKEWLRRYSPDENASNFGMQKHATELSIAIVNGEIVDPLDILRRLVAADSYIDDSGCNAYCKFCFADGEWNIHHEDDCIYKLAKELVENVQCN